ncbi:hypothetical protein DSO57_1023418 [Entomophthora muscae]|uniref:Uncharacterized protein n=1 Tax=Entomophthora muscae TaxID=34485 RepID=A0ACC2SRT6_9FUNG|nr:hypothetical protein DSO57_1023418 [Entomophthora muscae]
MKFFNCFLSIGAWSWRVHPSKPFHHNYVIALYRHDVYVCNGALYREDLALVPSFCAKGPMVNGRVELFRHDLNVTSQEESKRRPSWDPETGSLVSVYTKQYPASACIVGVHFMGQLCILKLESETSFYTGLLLQSSAPPESPYLIGWGPGNMILQQTSLPLYESNLCRSQLGYLIGVQFNICIQEQLSTPHAFAFKAGTPLMYRSRSSPTLYGLLAYQYKTPGNLSLAIFIRTKSFVKSIDLTALTLFKLPHPAKQPPPT